MHGTAVPRDHVYALRFFYSSCCARGARSAAAHWIQVSRGETHGNRAARRRLRLCEKMPYICPILREAINLPIYCQYLESQEPILSNPQRDAPAGEQNFELSGTKIPKFLKKSRAARPRDRLRHQKTHFYPQKRPKVKTPPK